MELYFHVDLAYNLKAGEVISKEPYRGESIIPAFMPFADDSFLRHLDKISCDGLSLHGAQYLIHIKHENVNVRDFLLELQFEYVRNVYNANMPSRLQSMFAFNKYEQAIEFKRVRGNRGVIFEIDFSGRCFIGDMNWLTPDLSPETQKQNAMQYWQGKPYSNDKNYQPFWECVIDLPVIIKREIIE